MKYKYFEKEDGFTLIELILAIALVVVVVTLSANLVLFGNKVQSETINQYDLQSSIRITTEKINETIRYSKAVFSVPKTFVGTTNAMDPGWDYLMVSSDGKRIVNMKYNEDSGEHEEEVQVDEQEGISYKMVFEKDKETKLDTVMKYKIYAYLTDEEGDKIKEEIVFESTVEAVNSIQVVDKGSESFPSIALAYRDDGQTSGKGKNSTAFITIVVDTSGSMNDNISGKRKIDRVREALTGTDSKDGIIQDFAKEENVFISIIPFATTANYPNPSSNSKPDEKHPIYEVYKDTEETAIITRIENKNVEGDLNADGATNTGDGLRRAYYLHDSFRTRMSIDNKIQVQHYTILLVDGLTNRGVKEGTWRRRGIWPFRWWEFNASRNYYTEEGNIHIDNRDYDYNVVSDSDGYVINIGNLIKNFESGNGVKSYIIGYANDLGTHINKIGSDIGTEASNIYKYDDPDFDLDEVFKNIANDIMADFWLVTGPQIQN